MRHFIGPRDTRGCGRSPVRAVRAFLSLAGVAAALALAAPAAGQQPSSPPDASTGAQPAATAIDQARELMEMRRYFDVLKILEPVARQQRVPADALFLIGVAGIEASQQRGVSEQARDALLDASIRALRAMLVQNPGLVRARLELARAFFLKGDEDGLARRHFEQVLAGEPPPPVALNVNRFLAGIRARKRWSVRVGAALAPDSNISSRTDEGTIVLDTPFGRLPFTVQDNERESGVGIAVWAGGEYQYPLDERRRLRSGGDISRREYRSSEFDRMFVSAHLGPRWLIGRASDASLLASVRQSWLADEAEYREPRVPRRGTAPAQRADHRASRRFPARTPLQREHPSRRAGDRHLGRRELGDDDDGAGQCGHGVGARADRAGAGPPLEPLDACREHGGASPGLHGGGGGDVSPDRLSGRLGAVRARRRVRAAT